MALFLCQRLKQGSAAILPLDGLARGWRRSLGAIGGFQDATFQLSGADLTRAELLSFFNASLGYRVLETQGALTTWEGYIQTMQYTTGLREYVRTLAPEWFHNKVRIDYTNSSGAKANTGWLDNLDSQANFGILSYDVKMDAMSSTGATALANRHLLEFAWPRTRWTGSLELGGQAPVGEPDNLQLTCVGYFDTLNWQYHTADAQYQAGVYLDNIVDASEFIVPGRIDTNTLLVYFAHSGAGNYGRYGDMARNIIGQGDASGNVWRGGVYEDRKFYYERAPTAVDHLIMDGRLTDSHGRTELPQLVRPGFLVRDLNAPVVGRPGGTASDWDAPDVGYVEQVDWDEELRQLTLQFSDVEESPFLLARRVSRQRRRIQL